MFDSFDDDDPDELSSGFPYDFDDDSFYEERPITVTEFLDDCNDYLRANFDEVNIVGEVAEFKTSQGKWVFFSLKDEKSTVNCFLPIFKLHVALEDGMKIQIRAYPKITPWGKFSLTVEKIIPVGKGSIKKAFDLLKEKLKKEGLFDPAKKRPIPKNPKKIGVISSVGAAGYADFCKILNARWGGMEIMTCNVQVQGIAAPGQIISALKYLNERAEVDAIAIIRGGGSKDDLSCFNDEALARAIASSRIPVITGIGHEVDESIADLVADIRASTPSNCAELLTSDRREEWRQTVQKVRAIRSRLDNELTSYESSLRSALHEVHSRLIGELATYESNRRSALRDIREQIRREINALEQKLSASSRVLESCNPEKVLKRGYAILRGKISPGENLEITTEKQIIESKITSIKERN